MERKPKRRPLTENQLRAISRELRRKAGGRCENCGTAHGTLIEMPDGSMFRYELALHRLNGNPRDSRRVNLRVCCQVCRGKTSLPHGGRNARQTDRARPAPPTVPSYPLKP